MSANIPRIHLLIERGRLKEAESLLLESLAKSPDDSYLHLLHCRALCDLERPKEAAEAARRAIGLDPESGLPHEMLARAMLESGRLNEAEAAIKEAQALDGDDADRRAMLARIYSDRGKHAKALEHAEAGLEIDPDHDSCRFFKGVLLARLGRHEEADSAAADMLADDPDASYNHSARGWILIERGSFSEAKMHFLEALRLDPENEDARIGYARSIQHQNPALGWFLRLIVRMERLPMHWLLAVCVLIIIVLPKYLEGNDKPLILHILSKTLRTAASLFFYASLAAQPIFDCLLALTKEGRTALSGREMQAVRWSVLPLIAGVVMTMMWLFGGAKGVPYQGLALVSAAVFLHEAFTQRHPWVRRRLIGLSAGVGAAAAWIAAGPYLVLDPMREELIAKLPELAKSLKAKEIPKEFLSDFERFLRFRNWALIYPSLALYLSAAFSDSITNALLRRAPDENDD